MPPHSQRKSRPTPWDGDVQDLECLGNGVSGIVFAIDSTRVAKIHLGTPRREHDFEIERAVYRRFSERSSKVYCRYVLRCLDLENPRGLVFERRRDTVRSRIREGGVEEGQVLQWAKQAAKGLAWVHDCKVIQGDGQLIDVIVVRMVLTKGLQFAATICFWTHRAPSKSQTLPAVP